MAAFFGLIAASTPIVIGLALWLAILRMDGDPVPPLVLLGGVAAFVLIGIVGWVAQLFDTNVARPIMALSRDLQTLMHANTEHEVDESGAKYLGLLGPTVREASDTIRQLRSGFEEKVAEATGSVERQRNQLETVLRDLNEGVIVCDLDHQVLLYNRRALQTLHYGGHLGLGRSIFTVVNRPPFLNTLERLQNRVSSGRYKAHPDYLTAPLVFATPDGRHVLHGKMSLVLDEAETTPESYVLTFSSETRRMSALASRDKLIREAIADLTGPVNNLRLESERAAGLAAKRSEEEQTALEKIVADCSTISSRIEKLSSDYKSDEALVWPMSDVNSANLLSCLSRRYREHPVIQCDVSGEACWLHCDSNLMIELMDRLIRHLPETSGAQTFTVAAECRGKRGTLDIIWRGEPVRPEVLSSWLEEEMENGAGRMSGRDVLDQHRSEAWSEALSESRACLKITVPAPVDEHHPQATGAPPVRLEFYDFDLLSRHEETDELARRRLRDLTYVVFDTETTGLEPSNGDEMVSIAGVRIVNNRVLTGEKFDELINPGRPIPKRSTEVHGISDAMVERAPSASDIVPRFRDYAGDSVLIAHNAAFDLRFLELKEAETGVRFDNPVLDTVLLSAIVHDHTDQHTLDAVAERFAIEIPEELRHTALGDSLATAHVFLKIVDLLEANGIRTFGEAQEASERLVEIRRRQSEY